MDHNLGSTVLLVDDEAIIREATGQVLAAMGFKILEASNGDEAVALVKNQWQNLALVIMDLTMPQMDGIEAFQIIHRLCPDLPVIISSGFSEHESIHGDTRGDLAGFIQKPYLIKDLRRVVTEAISNSKNLQIPSKRSL